MDQFSNHSIPVQHMRETYVKITQLRQDNPGLSLSIQISDLGPFVYARKGEVASSHAVTWLELERSRVNPLDLALNRVLRAFTLTPKEPN